MSSATTAIARKGKVMHIPGISKKTPFRRLTINDFTTFLLIFLFQTSFTGIGLRWDFLQKIRGTDRPLTNDAATGFVQYHPSISTMISSQIIIIAVIGFSLIYFKPFFRRKITTFSGFFHLLLTFVIAVLAALSLPTQGNQIDKTFPQWASERYGVELDSTDSKFFIIEDSLIKSKTSEEIYQVKLVDQKIYLHQIDGDELPTNTK